MKKTIIYGALLGTVIAIVSAACQGPASNTTMTANTVSNTSHAGHDMSNADHAMNGMPGHESMNMNSDPNAAEQPFDQQFLDSMIHHHRGAIMMAQMVLAKTDRPELKIFAQKIIDDQTHEIADIKELRERWYAGKASAVNMEMPGMIGGMKMMTGEHMKEMDEMEPKHFDNHFLTMMIAHHEGALEMSDDAIKKAEHPEVKQLAKKIIAAQKPEIEQMKKWKDVWDK
jgi:uncharacterized protein (DUF305 family)